MVAEAIEGRVELYRFKEVGDTFSSICTLVYNQDVVLIKGLCGTIDLQDWRELREYLTKSGVKEAFYERRKSGKVLYKKLERREGA